MTSPPEETDPNPIYVLDYPAMADAGVLWQTAPGPIQYGPPRRLHRRDCPHPPVRAIYRKASREELRALPECQTCARKAMKS